MVERRLHAAMFVNDHYYPAGSVVDVPEDFPAPMKTVEHGHDVVDLTPESPTNGTRIAGRVTDVPLWSTPGEDGAAPVFRPAETAMGGGTLKMQDEARLAELNGRDNLGEDETVERDELRQQIATSRNPTGNPPFKALAARNAHEADKIATGSNATPIAVEGQDHFTVAPPHDAPVRPGTPAAAAAEGSREPVVVAEAKSEAEHPESEVEHEHHDDPHDAMIDKGEGVEHEHDEHDLAFRPLTEADKHRLEDLETKPSLTSAECGELNELKSRKIAKLEDEADKA